MVFTPKPGDPYKGFIAEPGQCWRMVLNNQLQATHCREQPSWTGPVVLTDG